MAEARAAGRKLAKEIADDFMHIFANMALEVWPVTAREIERGVKPNPRADEAKFKTLSAILLKWVEALIPYQSARFQQIKFGVGEFDDGPDAEEEGALETLERLLDAGPRGTPLESGAGRGGTPIPSGAHGARRASRARAEARAER